MTHFYKNETVEKRLPASESARLGPAFWERRYARGAPPAARKARFLREFLLEREIDDAIELGCGDGAQLERIGYAHYTGVDVSRGVVEGCRRRFADHPEYRFFHVAEDGYRDRRYDLALSMDVLPHLLGERALAAYLDRLFTLSGRFVIVQLTERAEGCAPSRLEALLAERFPAWRLLDHAELRGAAPAAALEARSHLLVYQS